MATQSLSDHVLLIRPSAEPQTDGDLEVVARSMQTGSDRDVIVDFSLIENLPAPAVCHLIALQRSLHASGRQLVLCSACPTVLAVLRRLGLCGLFDFADDKSAAVRSLQRG